MPESQLVTRLLLLPFSLLSQAVNMVQAPRTMLIAPTWLLGLRELLLQRLHNTLHVQCPALCQPLLQLVQGAAADARVGRHPQPEAFLRQALQLICLLPWLTGQRVEPGAHVKLHQHLLLGC